MPYSALSAPERVRTTDLPADPDTQTEVVTNQTPQYPGAFGYPPPRPGLWSRLKPMQRVGVIVAALLLPCCGGVAVIGAFADDDTASAPLPAPAADQRFADPEPSRETVAAPSGSAATASPVTTESAGPVVARRTVTERRAVPFTTRTVEDDELPEGETRVRTKGVAGVRTLTYEVILTDGEETGRKLVKSVVTRKPVTKVVSVGTRTGSGGGGCDPNYRPCVPVAADVDCAGGSGNGPEYVDGPVRIIGADPYDLDRDGDGVACDD